MHIEIKIAHIYMAILQKDRALKFQNKILLNERFMLCTLRIAKPNLISFKNWLGGTL